MTKQSDGISRVSSPAFQQLDAASCQKTVKGNTSRQDRPQHAGSSSCWLGDDMLAGVFPHRLVLNPSKSVSLRLRTCAFSYQGRRPQDSFMSCCCWTAAQQSSVSIRVFIPTPGLFNLETTNKTCKKQYSLSNVWRFYKPLLCASLVKTICSDEWLRVKFKKKKRVVHIMHLPKCWVSTL